MDVRILYRSANLQARFRRAGNSRELLGISFAPLSAQPVLDRQGFCEGVFRSAGIDAVHVTCAGNDWYLYPDTDAMLAVIRTFAGLYDRIVTCGSSMGGTAALRFAKVLGAAAAIGISPQFSLSPADVPGEGRWQDHAARLNFDAHKWDAAPGCTYHCIYDDRLVDAIHVKRLAEFLPVVRVPVTGSGHPSGPYLRDKGILNGMLLDMTFDRFSSAQYELAETA